MKVSTATCTLPPLAHLLNPPRRPSSVTLDVYEMTSPSPSSSPVTPSATYHSSYHYSHPHNNNNNQYYPYHHSHPSNSGYRSPYPQAPLKAKRKRASPAQLSVLNHIFSQTYFPSTELRIELGKQLGMSPRAVQIWFQNKRQSLRTRERQQHHQDKKPHHHHHHHHPLYYDSPSTNKVLPPISPPLSPPSWQQLRPNQHQQEQERQRHHHYHHYQRYEEDDSCSRPSHISLPPLQLPSTPSQSSYPSPTSIDSIILH